MRAHARLLSRPRSTVKPSHTGTVVSADKLREPSPQAQ